MNFSLKISFLSHIDDSFVDALKDNQFHEVKLTSTKKEVILDRKDTRFIKSIDNVKIIFKKKDGGLLILIGNLQVDFQSPFGGSFFLKKKVEDTTDFDSIKGVKASLRFCYDLSLITSCDEMRENLDLLNNHSDFEFNIKQFDEFMEVFEFYKQLSNELNNNFSLEIKKMSEPYGFISSDVKDFELKFKSEVKDLNGVLKGYKFDNLYLKSLTNILRKKSKELIDIHVRGGNQELKKIARIGENNIYLSNYFNINEKNSVDLKQFNIINIKVNNEEIIISGELKNKDDYKKEFKFLNLYDMGQKIKVESIENSLRLINQGASGSAAELLEYLIGDREIPNLPPVQLERELKEQYLKGLNESQAQAFLKAIDDSPVTLIKGPPGTGKTHVINAIVQYVTKELKQKVVVSSQTHIAIDNILDKLIENYDLVIPNRITNRRNKYSGVEIDETLYDTWASNFQSHNDRAENLVLRNKMSKYMDNFQGENRFKYSESMKSEDYLVIGATTTTSAISGKKGSQVLKDFGWLIIDEVSKCPITEVLRYLPYVEKIIMVGDDFQLSPILEFSKKDVKDLESFDDDLFDKLQTIYEESVFSKVLNKAKKSDRLVLLKENYRSVKDILQSYNVFYSGELIGKREQTRPCKVEFKIDSNSIDYNKKDIFFVEVEGGQESKDGNSRFNLEEINATSLILKDIASKTKNPENVSLSVIFPYSAQIRFFEKRNRDLINNLKILFKSFEIDTVDAFQGKETDIVLVNTVVTDASQRNFLNNFRRINVSMSRAKDKLIVFGNNRTLRKIQMKTTNGDERNYFSEIIDLISSKGMMITYKGGEINDKTNSKNAIELI